MPPPPRNLPHFRIEGSGETERYTNPSRPTTRQPPYRDREQHAAALTAAIAQAIRAGRGELGAREPTIADGEPGFYLQVTVPRGESEAIDKLSNRTQRVELVSVKENGDGGNAFLEATVFVPAGAETYYLEKVEAYRDPARNTRTGHPANEALVARIDNVRLATVQSLFTDDIALFPLPGRPVWWEVWLRRDTRERFMHVADRLNIQRREHAVSFRERDVVLALADVAAMTRLIRNCDAVAELRLAKDTPALFLSMDGGEQAEWSDELLARVNPPGGSAPAVCLLDSGVTQGHPLIQNVLDEADMHTVEPAWGKADTATLWNGHGTAMSGVAIYGDLHPLFAGTQPVDLQHRLESVKILPPNGQNDPELYGAITTEAVARAETQAPHRHRVVCMAVTSANPVPGRPSSWSSAVDQLCFDEDNRRLVVLSAGNIRSAVNPATYPDANDLEPVEDPAQAWNALTAGAFTDKVNITDPDYAGWAPVGTPGDLSPCSRTSVTWSRQWPIKPDVVFEGGNVASDGAQEPEPIDDLRLLTTHWRPARRLLDTMGDTSAAAALGANMAARIMAARPNLWPETVRGMIVHSAEWTQAMRARMAGRSKTELHSLLRRYGYGVPDLDRAILSASNDLTLMIEDELRPFDKEQGSSTAKARDMRLHRLPWPRSELVALGETPVQFRVTLSYFVEPNPGERGWTRRHRYASHNLRFAVKQATETVDDFRRRINRVAREEEEGLPFTPGAGDNNWLLGTIRDRGSLHSDWWTGTAIDLAGRDAIGIYPVGGWWKEKPYLDRWDTEARYSLIVTIRAPGTNVDLYTPVANQIAIPVVVGRP
ncbi:S8 family peptidase [Niveispirillum sp. KHB5.9]|uniref:S8 family peptidase n=1 Tax=Niveispirillum sp. KHB5.9 TaxID=3400269 RepID=UPI003A8B8B40